MHCQADSKLCIYTLYTLPKHIPAVKEQKNFIVLVLNGPVYSRVCMHVNNLTLKVEVLEKKSLYVCPWKILAIVGVSMHVL